MLIQCYAVVGESRPRYDGRRSSRQGGSPVLTAALQRVAVIINPISGTGRRPYVARERAALAAQLMRTYAPEGDSFVTEGPGHGQELARRAVEQGAQLVVAWGGDGTVNEVASALAFHDAVLGVVPAGSGNGLARELGVPFDPAAALEAAFTGLDCWLDAGEIEGRLFFNVAGIGLDAHVAHRFAANGLRRRGLAGYVTSAAREMLAYEPDDHTIVVDGTTIRVRALLIAIANTRQYGSGAIIAPHARFDDGRLDVVAVAHRPLWAVLWHAPRLFTGGLAEVPGVTMTPATSVVVTSSRPMSYHVDGEPYVGGTSIAARVHAAALRVRKPRPR